MPSRRLLALVALAVIAIAGCSLKFEAQLVQPWNRPVDATSGERALVAKARHLLAGGLPDEAVMQNLVDQGLTQDEARRILALARAAEKKEQ
jgi:hypothetical protein